MRKLTLQLDQLHVETFEPLPNAMLLAGTVRGRGRDSGQEGCTEPPENTCNFSEWIGCTDDCSGEDTCKSCRVTCDCSQGQACDFSCQDSCDCTRGSCNDTCDASCDASCEASCDDTCNC